MHTHTHKRTGDQTIPQKDVSIGLPEVGRAKPRTQENARQGLAGCETVDAPRYVAGLRCMVPAHLSPGAPVLYHGQGCGPPPSALRGGII